MQSAVRRPSTNRLSDAHVSTKVDFKLFLEQLLETERLPLVAVSCLPAQSSLTPFPIDQFEKEIGDGAHIWMLEPDATFWLTEALGKPFSVYSGWVRVYPSDALWRTEERRAPLLQARTDSRRWLRAAVDTVLEVAYRDGFRPPVVAARGTVRAVVTVSGVLNATQVLVRTHDRRQAVMTTHHLWPGLAAERLVLPGQEFSGSLGSAALLAEFVPDPPSRDVSARVAEFVGDGVITLARLRRVRSPPGRAPRASTVRSDRR